MSKACGSREIEGRGKILDWFQIRIRLRICNVKFNYLEWMLTMDIYLIMWEISKFEVEDDKLDDKFN